MDVASVNETMSAIAAPVNLSCLPFAVVALTTKAVVANKFVVSMVEAPILVTVILDPV